MSPEAHLLECDRARERGDLDAAMGHVRIAALAGGLITGTDVAAMIAEDARIDTLSEAELAEELLALAANERLPADVRARMLLAAETMNEREETWQK